MVHVIYRYIIHGPVAESKVHNRPEKILLGVKMALEKFELLMQLVLLLY